MKELIDIQNRLNVPKNRDNQFGHYKYRSAEDILAAVKPLLKENKCVLLLTDDIVERGAPYTYNTQNKSGTTSYQGTRIYVEATATLINSDGEKISVKGYAREDIAKAGMDLSQVTGSASSYARKYALNGLFAIDDTADADMLNTNKQYTQQQGQAPFPPPQNAQQASQQLSAAELFQAYAKPAIEQAQTKEELVRIFNDYQVLHGMKEFMSAMTDRKKKLGIGKK